MPPLIFIIAWKLRNEPVRTGKESLIDRVGRVHEALIPKGIVQLSGEKWSAELIPGEVHAERGTRVQVVEVDGLKLLVRRYHDEFPTGQES